MHTWQLLYGSAQHYSNCWRRETKCSGADKNNEHLNNLFSGLALRALISISFAFTTFYDDSCAGSVLVLVEIIWISLSWLTSAFTLLTVEIFYLKTLVGSPASEDVTGSWTSFTWRPAKYRAGANSLEFKLCKNVAQIFTTFGDLGQAVALNCPDMNELLNRFPNWRSFQTGIFIFFMCRLFEAILRQMSEKLQSTRGGGTG